MKLFFGSFIIILVLASCEKRTETFYSPPITDYYPLQVGKTITYQLDSTLFTNFGQDVTIEHYEIQDIVDAEITDNLGRPSYRIVRYIRRNELQPWQTSHTYMVTPTENSLELVENNIRFLKLALPIKNGFSWKGNQYIDTYSDNYDIRYLDDWDYTYDSVGVPLTINNLNFESTIKVFERDEFLGQDPAIPGTQYGQKNYSVEKYAKGVGLIYRDFLHWIYQGPQSGSPGYVGYGVRLSITSHN